MDAFDLAGRRVVVTGASSGIGESIARAFLARGARVAGISLEGRGPGDGIYVAGDTGVFVGDDPDQLVSTSVGRWHLTVVECGLRGVPLQYPERWAVDA